MELALLPRREVESKQTSSLKVYEGSNSDSWGFTQVRFGALIGHRRLLINPTQVCTTSFQETVFNYQVLHLFKELLELP